MAVGVAAMVIYYNNVSDATEKWKNELEKTTRLQALQLELFKIWQSISSRGLSERAAALQQEQAIYEENKTKLIAQLTVVLAEEKKNGGQRIFAHNIVNSAIEDNLRIHNEKIKSINADFDKKEFDNLSKASKDKLALKDAEAKYLIDLNTFQTQQIADANKLAEQKAVLAPKLARLQKPMLPGLGASGYDFGKSKQLDLTLGFSIDQIKIAADMDKAAKLVTTKLKFINEQVKAIAGPGIVSALSGLGEGIAGALSGDNDPFEEFGIGLIKSLGAMAVQLGTQLLLIGAGLQIVPGLQYNAALYIAGGAALIVAGSAVSGLAGRKSQPNPNVNPSGGGGNISNPNLNSNYIGGNNSGKLVIEGYVRGNDINFVNGKSGSKNNRNLRFG